MKAMSEIANTPAGSTAEAANNAPADGWDLYTAMREANAAVTAAWEAYVAVHPLPMRAQCEPHSGTQIEIDAFAKYRASIDAAVAAEMAFLRRPRSVEAESEAAGGAK